MLEIHASRRFLDNLSVSAPWFFITVGIKYNDSFDPGFARLVQPITQQVFTIITDIAIDTVLWFQHQYAFCLLRWWIATVTRTRPLVQYLYCFAIKHVTTTTRATQRRHTKVLIKRALYIPLLHAYVHIKKHSQSSPSDHLNFIPRLDSRAWLIMLSRRT